MPFHEGKYPRYVQFGLRPLFAFRDWNELRITRKGIDSEGGVKSRTVVSVGGIEVFNRQWPAGKYVIVNGKKVPAGCTVDLPGKA